MGSERVQVRIDFVSDVVCPWCAIGLNSLEIALARLGDEVEADLRLQPFELNPDMPPEGQDIVDHLSEKYRITPAQIAANGEMIRVRGAELGFDFQMQHRKRTYNTFDAHRLLHWAELQGQGLVLKHALLRAYFTDGLNVADHSVLTARAGEAGLSEQDAAELLATNRYAAEVREQESFFTGLGIRGVPAVILNHRHLVQGGQPPEMFERALRNVAALSVHSP